MRVSESFLRRIDDWRREQPDLPARAEAIRRLVESSLPPPREAVTEKNLAALARQHIPEAVDILRNIVADEKSSAAARKKAMQTLSKYGLE